MGLASLLYLWLQPVTVLAVPSEACENATGQGANSQFLGCSPLPEEPTPKEGAATLKLQLLKLPLWLKTSVQFLSPSITFRLSEWISIRQVLPERLGEASITFL